MAKSKGIAAIKPNEEWRVEDDMRVLMSAKEIQADPKRMAKVKEMARKKLETMASMMGDASETK